VIARGAANQLVQPMKTQFALKIAAVGLRGVSADTERDGDDRLFFNQNSSISK